MLTMVLIAITLLIGTGVGLRLSHLKSRLLDAVMDYAGTVAASNARAGEVEFILNICRHCRRLIDSHRAYLQEEVRYYEASKERVVALLNSLHKQLAGLNEEAA